MDLRQTNSSRDSDYGKKRRDSDCQTNMTFQEHRVKLMNLLYVALENDSIHLGTV